MDPLRTVIPGEPWAPSAARENAWTEAARWVRDRQHEQVASQGGLSVGMVWVRNDSGADCEPLSILGIARNTILNWDMSDMRSRRVVLSGVVPQTRHRDRFVVVADGIRDGDIGRAWASGACPVLVETAATHGAYAQARAGNTRKLFSSGSGSCAILALAESPADQRAIVNLGGGGSSGYAARVVSQGGDAGTCSVSPLIDAIGNQTTGEVIDGVVLRVSGPQVGLIVYVVPCEGPYDLAIPVSWAGC